MYKYIIIGVIILPLPIFALVSTKSNVRQQEQVATQNERLLRNRHQRMTREEFESQFPIADYPTSQSNKTVSKVKQLVAEKRYGAGQLPVSEYSNIITTSTNWEVGLSALPVAESQAVVLAEVIGAEARFTSDRAVVYSEFELRIDEIIKDSDRTLTPNTSITVTRSGGRVRFPSGHITLQVIAGQNMPRVGQSYMFFLNRENKVEDFHILTAYEFQEGRVYSLDNPMGGTHPIATVYDGVEQDRFLRELHAALNNPPRETKN